MNIFMKKISISNGLTSPIVYIGNTETVIIFLNLKTCFAEDNWLPA